MALRAVIVDDNAPFLEIASRLLECEGITVVGTASTSAQAMQQAEQLQPDFMLIDVELGGESGFDLARRLHEEPWWGEAPTILFSTYPQSEFADLIDDSPALGFLSKVDLSGTAIRNLLDSAPTRGRLAHEALYYSPGEEFLATTVPFVREGLEAAEAVLVATKRANLRMLREALGDHADGTELVDTAEWQLTPPPLLRTIDRYVRARVDQGAPRVRIVAEPVWHTTSPRAVAEWKRLESNFNVVLAQLPVWFICAYDVGELPHGILADAERTHPCLRCGQETRRSPHYTDPEVFVRQLG